MAIKNTKMGGRDWRANKDPITPLDLKDTFDKLADLVEAGY